MDELTAKTLQTAYAMIKEGKQQQACEILVALVRAQPDLADAWFLLGHTLSEPQKQIQCFQQVLRIDPQHQPAQKQLARLQAVPISPFIEEKPAQKTPDTPQPVAKAAAPALKRKTAAKGRFSSQQVWVLAGGVGLLGCIFVFGLFWIISSGFPVMAELRVPATLTAVRAAANPVVATAAPAASPTPMFTPVFRGTACPFDIPLGTRVKCGVVNVPQDRTKNFTDLIELPVVLFQSVKPNADVIFYLQGGPGQEAIDWSLALFDDYVVPVLQEYDMVFFDPRGTGRSNPALDCPELNSVFLDGYFQNRSEDEVFKDFTAAWGKCHDRFIADGIDPAAFNTIQSAADVHDIAVAMGYEKVNLLGISYGTRLGLTVMRDYPDIVRSAVLDSVVPLEAKMFNRRAADVQYALKKVFIDCGTSLRCNSAYPNLEKVFSGLIERFDKEPVTIKAYDPSSGFTYDVKVNGVDMLSAVVWGLHTSELVPVIPKAIYDIQNGDYTFLSFALGVPGGEYDSMGMGTYFATVCPEQVYSSTPQEVDADLSLSPILKKFALAGIFGSSQYVFDVCKAWGARAFETADGLPAQADIPTLVISGQYDPTTPVSTGEMLAADLPDNHFYVIPGMGHGATVGNACSFQIMMEFLKDPTKSPDSSCLALANFEFFLPYDGQQPIAMERVMDFSGELRASVPSDWEKDPLEPVYFRHAYMFDPTLVAYQSFPFPRDEVLYYLTRGFADGGFEETPQKIDVRSGSGLEWTIYDSKYNGEPVIVALAQVSTYQTLGIIMVVSAPERDAFYSGLLLPLLDTYANH